MQIKILHITFFYLNVYYSTLNNFFHNLTIDEGILEAKTEYYAKDKVKSPPFFRSFYNDF